MLVCAITLDKAMQYWSCLHRPSIYIPLSAWTPHMPNITSPCAICHMPKYAQIWLNMPYLGIWHMAYGHAILGMWGVQALSGMYIDGLWRLDQYCIALSKVMAQTKICNFPPYKWGKFRSKSTEKWFGELRGSKSINSQKDNGSEFHRHSHNGIWRTNSKKITISIIWWFKSPPYFRELGASPRHGTYITK
jgi:hypothetical protein